jgi:hypothetical protein
VDNTREMEGVGASLGSYRSGTGGVCVSYAYTRACECVGVIFPLTAEMQEHAALLKRAQYKNLFIGD